MEWPQGIFDISKDYCFILNKCIYDLVQADKKDIKVLKKLGFMRGNNNPCLYIKKSAMDRMHAALCVDDNLLEGNIKAIDDMIVAFKENWLVLKIVEWLPDYLSYGIKFSRNK